MTTKKECWSWIYETHVHCLVFHSFSRFLMYVLTDSKQNHHQLLNLYEGQKYFAIWCLIIPVPRLQSYGIYISQLVRFARCCTNVFDCHSKNLQITSKLFAQGYRYHKLRKSFGKVFRSYPELPPKFGAISFQEYVSQGITHPVFYGDLVYKLRRVKSELISSRRARK